MSKILQPTEVIKARLGIDANGRVQRFFTNTCYKHMDKYVPMDTGDLRTIVDIQPDSITYEVPYAKRQYTTEFTNYTTEGTGPYWAEKMKSAEMNDVVKEVQEYARRHS